MCDSESPQFLVATRLGCSSAKRPYSLPVTRRLVRSRL